MAILSTPPAAAFDNNNAATGAATSTSSDSVTLNYSPVGQKTVYSIKLNGNFNADYNIQYLTSALLITPDGGIFNFSLPFFHPSTTLDLTESIVRIDRLWELILSSDDLLTLGSSDDNVNLFSGDDYVDAGAGNDSIVGGSGDDVLNGGDGIDTVTYSRDLSNYTITKTGTSYIVSDKTNTEGIDRVNNIEVLKFADKSINLRIKPQAAEASPSDVTRLIELYIAFFNRIPDADGLSYWIGNKTGGQTINQIADAFYSAGVQYSSLTGFTDTMSNIEFVNVIYKNVLGRKDGADADGLAYWTGKLLDGSASRGSLVSTILDSAHTYKGDSSFGYVADLLDNKIAVTRTVAIDYGLNYNNATEAVSNGMAIAAAVTPTDTAAAIALVGVNALDVQLA